MLDIRSGRGGPGGDKDREDGLDGVEDNVVDMNSLINERLEIPGAGNGGFIGVVIEVDVMGPGG